MNDSRECLMQSDLNLFSCKNILAQLRHCVKDPVSFKDFLSSSTKAQKGPISWDFYNNNGRVAK